MDNWPITIKEIIISDICIKKFITKIPFGAIISIMKINL
jgi:hypothetical protein